MVMKNINVHIPEYLMKIVADIDHHEIERRKETMRRIYNYQRVDHIPIHVWIEDLSDHTLRAQCESGEIQFEANVNAINRCLKTLPDDYIPYARVWPGYITIGTMFGIEPHWSDDLNQAPGLIEHPISDMSQVYDLEMPDPKTAGFMPFNLTWLKYFHENLPRDVYLTGIDLGGPMNTCKDLLDTNLLYYAFYDSPQEFHYLLDKVTDLQIACYEEIIRAVGGDINRLTGIDFDQVWAPEGRKGFVSDDVCASFGPEIFDEFSKPYNNRIFRKYGGGRLHNCGPNPAIDRYIDHEPEIKGLNCAFKYSFVDLPRIKEAFKGQGLVEFNFDCGETFDEIVEGYEAIAHGLAPDVIAMPLLYLDKTWDDDAITEVYLALRNISERYAREMNWIGE